MEKGGGGRKTDEDKEALRNMDKGEVGGISRGEAKRRRNISCNFG